MNGDKSSILDEIDKQMSDLQHEMDRYSLQESLSGADNEETTTGSDVVTDSITDIAMTPPPPPGLGGSRGQSYSPPPLPPRSVVRRFVPVGGPSSVARDGGAAGARATGNHATGVS